MDHHQLASEALDDILNPYDLRRSLAEHLAAVMFDGEEDEDEEDPDEEEDGDDDDENEDEDDDGDEDEPPAKGRRRRGGRSEQALQRENARRRVENRELKDQVAQLTKDLKKFTDKDKTKSEKLDGDLKTVTEERDKLQKQLEKLSRKTAVRDLADEHSVKDVAYFTFLLDQEGIELDEDGEWPDDVDKRVKRLIKKHKAHLNGSADEGDEDDEDDDKPPRVGPTGQRRRGGRKDAAAREQDLVKRFPALAGRTGRR